jgi:hypothetical protein
MGAFSNLTLAAPRSFSTKSGTTPMNSKLPHSSTRALLASIFFGAVALLGSHAQTIPAAATSTIEGRVLKVTSGG